MVDGKCLEGGPAALLRVAELVARGAPQSEVFEAVALEVARLLPDASATLVRYESESAPSVLAARGGAARAGTVGTPARSPEAGHQDGSSVWVPIVVEDVVWGALGFSTPDREPPATTSGQLQKFAELTGAAVANRRARARVVLLADEQAALRRVAELVARGASLPEVFAGIAVEASRLLAVGTALLRFDPDGWAEVVAAHDGQGRVGLRIPTTDSAIGGMFAAGQAARLGAYRDTGFAAAVDDLGLQPGTAVPITVEGRTWGALKTSPSGTSLRPGSDEHVASSVAERLEEFAALAAAAIASAENKAQLTASRARLVATADETRRRLQRDVHDGAQQRLVQTVLTLKLARHAAATGRPTQDLIDEALSHAERASAELRDLVHGILPASLSRSGLRSGIQSLVADLPVPVELDFTAPRLPASTEITAYFVVAEALTNVVKHAHATTASVRVSYGAERVTIEVRDDGAGGADAARGSGLTGLLDRVAAAEGQLSIASAPGAGTRLRAVLPVSWL